MAKEIEYKFLISDMKALAALKPLKHENIMQGYLAPPDNHTAIRVRISEWPAPAGFEILGPKKEEAFVTVKGPSKGLTRDEFEYPIPVADAKEMMQLCEGRFIDKVRYFFELPGLYGRKHIIEVDVFAGKLAGLIVAEIEVASEDEVVQFPSWFGKDVSTDHRYANS
jgi:adenylate cyclase